MFMICVKEDVENKMLEGILRSLKGAILRTGLALSLYSCDNTTNITNNYYGRDGGISSDVTRSADAGNNAEAGLLSLNPDLGVDGKSLPDAESVCAAGSEPECVACDTAYSVDDEFRLRNIPFTYLSSTGFEESVSHYAHFRNDETGFIAPLIATERVIFRVLSEYSFLDYNGALVDDFDIALRYPCGLDELTCGTSLSVGTVFSLDGHLLEYSGADRITKTNPVIRFWDEKSGETLEYLLRLGALFEIEVDGVMHYFENDPNSNHLEENYSIRLVHPCEE